MMQLVLSTQKLRRDWRNHPEVKGLLLEKDIAINLGRLRAKLLVFQNRWNLHHFWRECLGKGNLGRGALGAVNGLFQEVITCKKGQPDKSRLEVDPRYFCVIGLTKNKLTMEVIAHESVHAAFAFAKRCCRSPWDQHAESFDEEGICYPAGRLAAAINRTIHAAGLYHQ